MESWKWKRSGGGVVWLELRLNGRRVARALLERNVNFRTGILRRVVRALGDAALARGIRCQSGEAGALERQRPTTFSSRNEIITNGGVNDRGDRRVSSEKDATEAEEGKDGTVYGR